MERDKPLDHGQTEPCPLIFVVIVALGLNKRFSKLIEIPFLNTDTLIGDTQLDGAFNLTGGQSHGSTGIGKFDRVRQEIEHDLTQSPLVCHGVDWRISGISEDRHFTILGRRCHHIGAHSKNVGNRDFDTVDFIPVGLDPGHIEQIIDDRQKMGAAFADQPGKFLFLLFGLCGAQALDQNT